MDISNEGSSFYHRLIGLFQRNDTGVLQYCTKSEISQNWPLIQSSLRGISVSRAEEETIFIPKFKRAFISFPDYGTVIAYELVQAETGHIVGLILNADKDYTISVFETFFATTLLNQVSFCSSKPVLSASAFPYDPNSMTEALVNLFDKRLRYSGANDQWNSVGKAYFTERVSHFVLRGARLELCLPAFPCKSSNTDKVLGVLPDLGEALALEWLHDFVQAVEDIYSPGAKLWIVSDGHVFSDCGIKLPPEMMLLF